MELPSFLIFSLIFMNMQKRSVSYRTIKKDLSNSISDAIKTCNNGGLMVVRAEISLFMVLFYDSHLFLRFH